MRAKLVPILFMSFMVWLAVCIPVCWAQTTFITHKIDDALAGAFAIYSMDFNKDGAMDILCGGQGGAYSWYRNNGSGSFSKIQITASYGTLWSVCAADVDGDGDNDPIAASITTDEIVWWKNSGGSFTKKNIGNLVQPEAVRTADMDKDGDVDVVAAAWINGELDWFENQGNDSFIKHIITADYLKNTHYICVADLDGDGDWDIGVASADAPSIVWFQNGGNNSYALHTVENGFSGAYCIEAFDMDKDGRLDLLGAAHNLHQIAWWKNNGGGVFSSKKIIANNFTNTHSAFAGDIDADGDIDIAGTARDLDEIAWFENNGSYSFTKHSIVTNIDQAQTVTLADYNNDGRLDIASESRITNEVYWWENEGPVIVETVSTPNQLTGPTSGMVGENLSYTAGGAVSNYSHPVQYQFDWGNGNQSSWGSANRSYSYSAVGNYQIRARARCQIHTEVISSWSNSLTVTISPNEYAVSGVVTYYSNNNAIANVTIAVSGEVSTTLTTNSAGDFNFNAAANKSFTMTPAKGAGDDIGPLDISTYDAVLTARGALKLLQLDAGQQIAADADKDGNIYTYDAALIARYAVGLPQVAGSHVGDWLFQPQSRAIQNINAVKSTENFIGYIIGNVHGGWSSDALMRRKPLIEDYRPLVQVHGEQDSLVLSLIVNRAQDIISVDAEIAYDEELLLFSRIRRSPVTKDFHTFQNNRKNCLRIGMYTVYPLNEGGTLIEAVFESKAKAVSEASLKLTKLLLNDDVILQADTDMPLASGESLQAEYQLYQNFPNPFNSTTKIRFDLAQDASVCLQVFNLFGQEIKSLVNGYFQKGQHEVLWDGTDGEGKAVVSGIYLYQLNVGNYKSTKKIIVIE